MRENERICLDAELRSVIKDGVFRAQLANGHQLVAYSNGDDETGIEAPIEGLRVVVQMSPYDMSKGLIVGQPEK